MAYSLHIPDGNETDFLENRFPKQYHMLIDLCFRYSHYFSLMHFDNTVPVHELEPYLIFEKYISKAPYEYRAWQK